MLLPRNENKNLSNAKGEEISSNSGVLDQHNILYYSVYTWWSLTRAHNICIIGARVAHGDKGEMFFEESTCSRTNGIFVGPIEKFLYEGHGDVSILSDVEAIMKGQRGRAIILRDVNVLRRRRLPFNQGFRLRASHEIEDSLVIRLSYLCE